MARRLVRAVCAAALVYASATAAVPGALRTVAAGEQGLRPFLAGVLVGDLDASRRWYEAVLDFRVAEGGELPATRDMSGVILERDGFRLELIARTGSFAASSRLPKDDEALLRGIKKLALIVDDLGVVAARASARGTRIVREIHASRYAGMRTIILADPDGNWIQLYDRRGR
jgi:catechol 2,3-dioxygenase-like lactoylglutathione lyase family enzyme